jgi:hypothetical protein
MKCTNFWDVTTCSPVVAHLCFGATHCPRYHGPRHNFLAAPFSPTLQRRQPHFFCRPVYTTHCSFWPHFLPPPLYTWDPLEGHVSIRNCFFLLVRSGLLPNPVRNHVSHTRPIKLAPFFLLVSCLACLRPWGRRPGVPLKSRWISAELRRRVLPLWEPQIPQLRKTFCILSFLFCASILSSLSFPSFRTAATPPAYSSCSS